MMLPCIRIPHQMRHAVVASIDGVDTPFPTHQFVVPLSREIQRVP
jgi:hypothetical protein